MRKKYQVQLGSPAKDGEPQVSAPPEITAAELPPAVEPRPIEQPQTQSPADAAASSAIKDRLAEMERAEQLARQPANQPQHTEPQTLQEPQEPTLEQVIANLPERVKRWYRAHPEFLTDPEKSAQIQYCHHVARREVGEEMTEPYFDRMEQMLGLRRQTQPNGNGRTESAPTPPTRPVTVDRPAVRPSAAPVSAPPTRQVPSMSTGRAPTYRAPLTQDELLIAQQCGQTPEQYQQQKERMLRMKAAGELNQ